MRQFLLVTCSMSMWVAMAPADPVFADSLWTEDAENGTTYIIDGSAPSYSLVQSDVAAQGSSAFHLANPGFQDNWFELDRTITVESDTRLFFLSRLRAATSDQVARVQISTDAGTSWATDIHSQIGSGSDGEPAFSLRDVDLASYADQDVRFRFMFDFQGGSAFTDTNSFVGWFVDDIQIADRFEKVEYSIGNPTDYEQLYLEYINRARSDALAEARRLASETDPDIESAYSSFDIDRQEIVDQFTSYVNNGCIDQRAKCFVWWLRRPRPCRRCVRSNLFRWWLLNVSLDRRRLGWGKRQGRLLGDARRHAGRPRR